MNKHTDQFEADPNIIAEASQWVARIETGPLASGERDALKEWMTRSPAHVNELRWAVQLSKYLNEMTELTEPVTELISERRKRLKPQPNLGAVMALSCLLLVALGSLFFLPFPKDHVLIMKEHRTAIGQHKAFVLADGSTVELNTNSHVRVEYSEANRAVYLLQGEALFKVNRDPTRPFVVYSQNQSVRALGTVFLVRQRGEETELSVLEGKVAFSHKKPTLQGPGTVSKPAAQNMIVRAGEELSSAQLTPHAQAPTRSTPLTLSDYDLQRKIAWTEGLLDFSDTPLPEVIAEVTRYHKVQIDIADPALQQMKLGGIFRTGDVQPFLEALEGLGVTVEAQPGNRYLLSLAQ